MPVPPIGDRYKVCSVACAFWRQANAVPHSCDADLSKVGTLVCGFQRLNLPFCLSGARMGAPAGLEVEDRRCVRCRGRLIATASVDPTVGFWKSRCISRFFMTRRRDHLDEWSEEHQIDFCRPIRVRHRETGGPAPRPLFAFSFTGDRR